MNQMISIAKRFAKIIKADDSYDKDEITRMIDEREKESPTPWSGEETIEYAIVAPLHSALSNIDSNNLEAARDNILDALDIIKMKKVSKRFSRFLKIAQETKAEVPHAVNKYIENKIKSEEFEKNDELDFALSALHSALGVVESNPDKALTFIHLAINSITKAINSDVPSGTSVEPGTPIAVVQSS